MVGDGVSGVRLVGGVNNHSIKKSTTKLHLLLSLPSTS